MINIVCLSLRGRLHLVFVHMVSVNIQKFIDNSCFYQLFVLLRQSLTKGANNSMAHPENIRFSPSW